MKISPRTAAATIVALAAVLTACGTKTSTSSPATATTAAAPATANGAATSGTTNSAATPTAATTGSGAPGAATSAAPTATDAAVAGDIPDNQAFVAYAPAGAGYSIKVPEGWARSSDGSATVFTDKFNSIRIETATAPAAPTVASVTSGDVAGLATAKGYGAGKVSAATRKAGPVIVATYQLDSAANAVTSKTVKLDVERYVFWRSPTSVVVTLSSAAGSDNVDPWRTVTDGFAWQ